MWECGQDKAKQDRFEAWTNNQLDGRENEYFAIHLAWLVERQQFKSELEESLKASPQAARAVLGLAENLQDPAALANWLTDPKNEPVLAKHFGDQSNVISELLSNPKKLEWAAAKIKPQLMLDPKVADVEGTKNPHKRPPGTVKTTLSLRKKEERWARLMVRIVGEIWKQHFERKNRGNDTNPPTAGQIILRRMEDRYKIKVDPHSVGVKHKDWKRRK